MRFLPFFAATIDLSLPNANLIKFLSDNIGILKRYKIRCELNWSQIAGEKCRRIPEPTYPNIHNVNVKIHVNEIENDKRDVETKQMEKNVCRKSIEP